MPYQRISLYDMDRYDVIEESIVKIGRQDSKEVSKIWIEILEINNQGFIWDR